MTRIVQAFVQAEEGDRDGAIRRVIESMAEFKATGASIVMSQFEPRLAELLIESGDPAQAARRLSESIADAERRAERTYLPELYRVRAVARGKLGDLESAVRDCETAVTIAVAQGASPLVRSEDHASRLVRDARERRRNEGLSGRLAAGDKNMSELGPALTDERFRIRPATWVASTPDVAEARPTTQPNRGNRSQSVGSL